VRKLCLKDERGQLIAFLGNRAEFEAQHDAAKILSSSGEDRLAWIDWVESSRPGNGSSLLAEAIFAMESEGVTLIGLEVYARPEEFDRVARFYGKFGFVGFGDGHETLADGRQVRVMTRETDWNGMEP